MNDYDILAFSLLWASKYITDDNKQTCQQKYWRIFDLLLSVSLQKERKIKITKGENSISILQHYAFILETRHHPASQAQIQEELANSVFIVICNSCSDAIQSLNSLLFNQKVPDMPSVLLLCLLQNSTSS